LNNDRRQAKTRLDRFISHKNNINKRDVRLLLAQRRIVVDGEIATNTQQIIQPFTSVILDNKSLQDNEACYLMLNKPTGVVSATKDKIHKTVIDLLNHPQKGSLHITGRLDLNSSGLLLLTNDSNWSRKLMLPDRKVTKIYHVTTEKIITPEYINLFKAGMHFPYENITTKPVNLKILSEHSAELELTEGRYHQIKRMFGRFRNPVLKIHRLSVGNITLDPSLTPGESRCLSDYEIQALQ
jgi:16S rRNA pseudouridine516 synthase